jgi:hypothetical protein
MKMHYRNWMALGVLAAAACGGDAGDKTASTATTKAPAPTVSPDEYRKAQQRIADSVLNQIKGADDIVKDLGKGYEVGSVRLRDSIAVLATKSNCFLDGRQSDPYLAGTVSFYVFMSVVGTNVVRVQENATKWTSTAGNIVNSCLNVAAKNWTFDTSFGKPANYIIQVQFK